MKMDAIKLIIFDYDGVIADSFPVYNKIYKIICEKFDKPCPESIEEFRRIYGDNSKEYYKNAGFSAEEALEAARIIKQELPKHDIKAFSGIKASLVALHKKYKLAVISSSPHEEVEHRLKKFGLHSYFDFVFGRPPHQLDRLSKTEYMQKVISDLALKPEQVLLIGDRNVDFIEGSSAGLTNIILVEYGWGYNLEKIPDYRQIISITKPTDLLKLIK